MLFGFVRVGAAVKMLGLRAARPPSGTSRADVDRVIATRRLESRRRMYKEKASAAKERAVFDRMMRDAHQGAFDVLVVWALDRFGRSFRGRRARL
jgi:DNA invertase Pin-like site-specific DNA recombinase